MYNQVRRKETVLVTTTLNRWGNSQGVTVPKRIVDLAELSIGDVLEVSVGSEGAIVLTPVRRKYRRSNHAVTIDDLFQGYKGGYQPTESDWGASVGRELPW
jgi:antitoxin MazE